MNIFYKTKNFLPLIGALAVFAATAAESDELDVSPAAPIAQLTVAPAEPDMLGLTVVTSPIKQQVILATGGKLLEFRPNPSMPELVNEPFILGMLPGASTVDTKNVFLGYMPRITLVPCAVGCSGADYKAAVAKFIQGYSVIGMAGYKPRGLMMLQVRWFRSRTFIDRMVPLSSDVFGVSFALEGKLVSAGERRTTGFNSSAADIAYSLGNRLAANMILTVALGAKPSYLAPIELSAVAAKIDSGLQSYHNLEAAFGRDDVRLRVEPLTAANSALLPAIDGVLPGEVNPVTEPFFPTNVFMF